MHCTENIDRPQPWHEGAVFTLSLTHSFSLLFVCTRPMAPRLWSQQSFHCQRAVCMCFCRSTESNRSHTQRLVSFCSITPDSDLDKPYMATSINASFPALYSFIYNHYSGIYPHCLCIKNTGILNIVRLSQTFHRCASVFPVVFLNLVRDDVMQPLAWFSLATKS